MKYLFPRVRQGRLRDKRNGKRARAERRDVNYIEVGGRFFGVDMSCCIVREKCE